MSNRTVTRADLAEAIYNELGLSRNESSTLVEQVLGEITEALIAGKTVKISSFGSFGLRQKGERVGRNPKTGVEVPITPRKVLVFKASHVLKDAMNGIAPSDINHKDDEFADD
ncbi:MAG: integration host factor subunit alpha [Alphaproteobacteria bacterium]|nr:integration host factor subunit alpha [Alphaproteobacteria bacterium]